MLKRHSVPKMEAQKRLPVQRHSPSTPPPPSQRVSPSPPPPGSQQCCLDLSQIILICSAVTLDKGMKTPHQETETFAALDEHFAVFQDVTAIPWEKQGQTPVGLLSHVFELKSLYLVSQCLGGATSHVTQYRLHR